MGLFRPYQPKAESGSTTPTPTGDPEPKGPTVGGRVAGPLPVAPTTSKKRPWSGRSASATPPPTVAASAAPRPIDRSSQSAAPPAPAAGDRPAGRAPARTPIKAPTKKSAPTPTRRQAEAARQQRINPVLDKKSQRRQDRLAREKQRQEGFQRVHDKGVSTMIRDYVDSRWSFAEFVLPVMLLTLVSLFAASAYPALIQIAMVVTYSLLALVMLDTIIMWRGCRKAIRRYFPDEPLKGKFGYATSRAMMMRRTRQPRPQVKRGSGFTWPRPVH